MRDRAAVVKEMLNAYHGDVDWHDQFVVEHQIEMMFAALAVAEAAFARREAHEPIGCPTPGACSCVVSQDDARADLVRWLEEQLRIKIHTVVFDDLVNGQQSGRPLAFLIEQAQLTQDAASRARVAERDKP